jgi:hypothetical protein
VGRPLAATTSKEMERSRRRENHGARTSTENDIDSADLAEWSSEYAIAIEPPEGDADGDGNAGGRRLPRVATPAQERRCTNAADCRVRAITPPCSSPSPWRAWLLTILGLNASRSGPCLEKKDWAAAAMTK